MILCIGDLLNHETLQQVRDCLAELPYSDGRATAGWHARLVKQNEQADGSHLMARQAESLIRSALEQNSLFQSAALPQNIRPFLFARYRQSMSYGAHVDDAIMDNNRFRADIAMTVFLNDAADYDGGELVLDSTGGEQGYKLDAGQAIIYPANTLHQVTPVTSGERLVAVSWIQSLVRAAEQRSMLFEVDTTRRQLFDLYGKTAQFDALAKLHANLLRHWASP